MKRILLVALFGILSQSLFAQLEDMSAPAEAPNRFRVLKHELGMGLVGGGDVRQTFWALPGLTYRYFLPNGAVRVVFGGSINQNSTSGGFGGSNNLYGFVTRIGYQYHVPVGRFMPRIGCDISGGLMEESWDSWNPERNFNRSISVGLSPSIGLDFWFTPKLSVGIETRFDVAYREYQSEYTYVDWPSEEPITTITNQKGIGTTIGPVSVFTFGFHF